MLAFHYSWEIFSQTMRVSEAEAERLCRDYSYRAVVADKSDFVALTNVAAAYTMLGEIDRAKPLIEMAYAINPRDIEVINIRGWITALGGETEEGRKVVEWVNRLEHTMDPGYRLALCDVRYMARDYDGVLSALEMIIDPPYMCHIYKAICLAQLGRTDEAKQSLADGKPVNFNLAAFARRSVAQCSMKEDKQHWLEGFRKAGIQV
jgi:adenylate cyclase